jgi:hypothetical protein
MFQEARNHNRDFGLDGDFDSKAQAYVNATPGFAAATAAGIDLQDAVANFSVIRKALYTNSPIYGFEGQRLPTNATTRAIRSRACRASLNATTSSTRLRLTHALAPPML